jgi:signal recognition particle subunit SRP54
LKGLGQLPQMAQSSFSDKACSKLIAIINSMTPRERQYPDLIKGSHKQRIAKGSGSDVQAVGRLLKQFEQAQKTMKKMGRKGQMNKMMQGLQGMMQRGGTPPGLL